MSSRMAEYTVSREHWDNKLEFMLSCIGYSVGLGNLWRFPYLCFTHGGAAFMLAYLFLQLTIGKPLYFMELSAGQYSSKSCVRVWDLCPAFRGVGFSMCTVSLYISMYYNVIMAYILYYFFASFLPEMPWTVCKEEWENCYTERNKSAMAPLCKELNKTWVKAKYPNVDVNSAADVKEHLPYTLCRCSSKDAIDQYYDCSPTPQHASALYFGKEVLNMVDNLVDYDFGTPSWKLSLLLLLSWIIVFLSLVKGIKTSGKVVYFTATFPYIVLLVMLFRGSLLDGAWTGVKEFLIPKWEKLVDFQMWLDAAGQMFFSLSLSMGGIIMYGSYNPFYNPIYRDAVIISTADLLTSCLAGFVVFSTLGYMAKQTNSEISDVAKSSFGLVFVIYPETLSTLAVPNMWSCLFFFMLYTLGLDSQFALLETVLAYLMDDFAWCRFHVYKIRAGVSLILYLLGLIILCPGGPYLIDVIDTYGVTRVMTIISMMECVAIMWGYGIKKFIDDLEYMLGSKPRALPYWYFVWGVWSPVFLLVLFFAGSITATHPKYGDGLEWGWVMMGLSWFLFAFCVSHILTWFILHAIATNRRKGPFATRKQFGQALLAPSPRWGPADGENPELLSRSAPVWADVLGWKCLQGEPRFANEGTTSTTAATVATSASQGGRLPPPVPPNSAMDVMDVTPEGDQDQDVPPPKEGEGPKPAEDVEAGKSVPAPVTSDGGAAATSAATASADAPKA